jgi:hypothetical protein
MWQSLVRTHGMYARSYVFGAFDSVRPRIEHFPYNAHRPAPVPPDRYVVCQLTHWQVVSDAAANLSVKDIVIMRGESLASVLLASLTRNPRLKQRRFGDNCLDLNWLNSLSISQNWHCMIDRLVHGHVLPYEEKVIGFYLW